MSFMNANDMIEEDAADLQFPKDVDIINAEISEETKHKIEYCNSKVLTSPIICNTKNKCASCNSDLKEPFIKCADCYCTLCPKCFAQGKETQYHLSSHSYIVVHDNIVVFPGSDWTAAEEKKLLNLIESYGYGNWKDIAIYLQTRSAEECRNHYHSYYFNGIFKKLLGLSNDVYFPQTIPFICNPKSINPPRYDIDSINFKNMAGYRFARGEFDVPYDNSAESIISNLELNNWQKEYKSVIDQLHCGMFRVYNHRIQERHRRYKVMRDHGLLLTHKNYAFMRKYAEALNPSLQNSMKVLSSGRFVSFMQIMNPVAFDFIVESLQLFTDLKKYLFKLYDLRKNGITSFCGAKIYQKLKYKRYTKIKNKRNDQNIVDWRSLIPKSELEDVDYGNILSLSSHTARRKEAPPLDIIAMPGYDKLNENEREICSRLRLTPLAYLEYKEIFMKENLTQGYLRLADARRLIKIDVNKTRKLYDFLIDNGFINKEFS